MNQSDFSQNMAHDDAIRKGYWRRELPYEQYQALLDKIDNQTSTFPNRPDWDGYLTLSEANDWYRNGNGESLYADLSKINLSRLLSLGELFVNQEKVVNLFFASITINDALVYGTVDYVDLKASSVTSGITLSDLEFGSSYIFRIIGYDKDGKVTNMGKKDFSPSVGKVVSSTDSKWAASKPTVLAEISGNAIALSVTFPQGCSSYVVTKMSPEEYSASMPGSARLKTDYVVGHGSALTFNENLDGYDPGWYISSDLPYILVVWTDGSQWYEPLVIDSATGQAVN